MTDHLSWETLNDYADDAISPVEHASVARHLDGCASCRESLMALRGVLAAAAAAKAVEPPAEAWTAIRSAIEEKKVVALPVIARREPGASRWRLAAAAAALVVVSSGATVVIMNTRSTPTIVVSTPVQSPSAIMIPASLTRVESGYLKTVDELTAAVNDSKLSAETVRAVQRSLRIIDDAIAEARAAVLRDPASDVLHNILAKNYEQKVDLLRRASARALQSGE